MTLSPAHTLPRDTSSSQSFSALNKNSLTIHTDTSCLDSLVGHETRAAAIPQLDNSDASDSATPSSVFSRMSSFAGNGAPTLTPITNSESSPPDKTLSPTSKKRKFDELYTNGITSPSRQDAPPSRDPALTPTQTPPELPHEARPARGQIKGHKLTFDPDTAPNLDSSSRKKLKPKYNTFGDQHDLPTSDPRLMYPDYPAGAFQDKPGEKPRPNKARWRPAPYVLRPYNWDSKNSVGRGPAEQVVVYDFDPLLVSEMKIRTTLGQYGDVTESKNMTDPTTGAFLGICVVKFGDRKGLKRSATAADSARRAEKEGNGQRIDQWQVRVERDPEGVRSKRFAESKISKRKLEIQTRLKTEKSLSQPQTPASIATPPKGPKGFVAAPPPNAPKGPSLKPPQGPRPVVLLPPRTTTHSLVEQVTVLSTLKRSPYVFLAHCYVPVLGSTIYHLQKRMKSYTWKEIRCDKTGYYIVFDDSRRGQDEAQRLFDGCNMLQLFTYTMNMELQKHGNPFYARSPTPERVAAEQAVRDENRKIRQDDEADFETEKLERAKHLDPARAALERLKSEMHDLMLADLKTKQGAPHIHKRLDPANEKNIETREKFSIPEPVTVEAQRPFTLARPEGPRTHGTGAFRGGIRKFALQRGEVRKNAYLDDRRAITKPRVRQPQALHYRLQDYDSDSDDERRTSVTRGSDGFESRAISEAARSPARFEVDDDGHLTPHAKRQRTDRWGQDSDDESVDVAHKSLGSLLDKDLEEMSESELERVLSTLKAADPIRKKALKELKHRRKALDNERLFFDDTEDKASAVDTVVDDTDSVAAATPEPFEIAKIGKKKSAPKTKRKTKKQIQEEHDAAARAEMEAKLDKVIEQAEAEVGAAEGTDVAYEEDDTMLEIRPEVEWGVSTTEPRRTVQDDFDIVLDVDGWQHFVKDDEDLQFLKTISKNIPATDLECDADLWAHNQKKFKSLNTPNVGITKEHLEIPGYYVPNPTGCARTQPHTKIFEDEKSKYLPHRIKVKNLREERQAEAKRTGILDPLATAKAPGKQASKVNSRASRVDNRHLQRDIALVTTESDTFAMNALKKRKKCVRFDRSSIHGWGLYAEENIGSGEMIIEYVGEKVRQKVADVREVMYDLQGVGSSYLFRIDDEHVVDATKKGGIARFINHSCMPNCTAKIIKVDGTKRIVIYALRDIGKDEELTYDYKFEREMPDSEDRVPCLCSTVLCQGYLN